MGYLRFFLTQTGIFTIPYALKRKKKISNPFILTLDRLILGILLDQII